MEAAPVTLCIRCGHVHRSAPISGGLLNFCWTERPEATSEGIKIVYCGCPTTSDIVA